MALSAPLLKRKRVLQVKIETTKGTLVAADTDALVYDLTMDPEDPFVERKLSGKVLGHTSPGVLEGTAAGSCKFKMELRGDGSQGMDPALAIMLQACGQEKTLEVYTPTSVHATQKTISLASYEDGVKKQLAGAMGTFKLAPDGGRLVFDFEFSGVWQAPIDAALPTVAYSVLKPLPWGAASNAFSLDSESIKISTFEFDVGNEVVPRMDNGRISYYAITDRDPTMTLDPETDKIAGYDLYGKWLAGTEVAISLAVTDGTDTMTLAGSKFQYREAKEGDREKFAIDDVTGQFNIVTINTGDDEYSMTIS